MQKDYLNRFWIKAATIMRDEKRWQEFYSSQGLRFDLSAVSDSDGWIEASGCVFNQAKIEININNGKWRDPFTEVDGDVFSFLNQTHRYAETDPYLALADICKYAGVDLPERADITDPDEVTAVSPEALKVIMDRLKPKVLRKITQLTGINEVTAARYKLGWFPTFMTGANSGGELAVPISDADGSVKAIRCIDENLTSRWLNKIPRGNKLEKIQRLYGLDDLKIQNWKNVIITNSELDRLVLMQEKNTEEWGVLSIVDGYSRAWNNYFHGRNVVLVFSCDHYSVAAAQNVVAPMLRHDVNPDGILGLKCIKLSGTGTPEDCKVYHWFKNGGTWDSLLALEKFQPHYETPGRGGKNSPCKNLISFTEIDDPVNNGLKVRVPITVTGEYNEVYDSIDEFEVTACKKITDGSCRKCEGVVLKIDPTSPKHLAAYDASEAKVHRLCIEHCCDVPGNRPTIGNLTRSTYRKIIATQCFTRMVDRDFENNGTIIEGKRERIVEKQIIVKVPPGSPQPIDPRSYMATGAVHTNPLDSTRSMIVENLDPIPEDYETFSFKLHSASLSAMRDIGWAGIVADLTLHRTRMFGYDELMIINLLALCSPLHFNFNGEKNRRGWIVACIVGDTGVGKSKTYEDLMKMTGIGSIFNAKNGRRTGFTHATLRMGAAGGFRVQAGLYPLSSRKIILVEEAQRLDDETITSMSEAMYDGVLKVNNAARANYECKTRLIMNCNCKLEKPMDDYALGCLALKELFDHTFIRRLDIAAFVRKFADMTKYHKMSESAGDAAVSPEMMRHLIYYAWSLTPDRIEFSREVTEYIMEKSMAMIKVFGKPDDISLVYASDFRLKLARISLAWAVLSLSSPDSFKTIEVKREHVDLTVKLLTQLYAHPDCGLDKYSDQWARAHSIEDYDLIRDDFVERIITTDSKEIGEHSRFARLIGLLRTGVSQRRNELARTLRFDFKWVEDSINYLIDHNLVRIELDRVKITAKFNRVMTRMEREDRAVFVPIVAASMNVEIDKTEETKKEE